MNHAPCTGSSRGDRRSQARGQTGPSWASHTWRTSPVTTRSADHRSSSCLLPLHLHLLLLRPPPSSPFPVSATDPAPDPSLAPSLAPSLSCPLHPADLDPDSPPLPLEARHSRPNCPEIGSLLLLRRRRSWPSVHPPTTSSSSPRRLASGHRATKEVAAKSWP